MTIYPPYTKWKTIIKEPSKFDLFLKQNIDTIDSETSFKYKGKLSLSNFLIERKLGYYNTNRPQIQGVINQNSKGEQELTLSIKSKNNILFPPIVLSGIILLTSIFRQKPIVLIAIPIVIFWFWLIGLILHQIELKKTKLEIKLILENAAANT